jgi:hypothetical protein
MEEPLPKRYADMTLTRSSSFCCALRLRYVYAIETDSRRLFDSEHIGILSGERASRYDFIISLLVSIFSAQLANVEVNRLIRRMFEIVSFGQGEA